MKNMKKFITLCGFLILGSIACGDADVVKAEAINEQTTDTSDYTITIPSDVDIDKDSGKGSFAVTGKVKAQSTIDVSIQSKNGYKLKDKNGELPYNIDKKSFSIDNSRSASDIPLNVEFNIVSKTNTKVSGYYTDSLTFDITSKKYEYLLDVNGSLDGGGAGDGSLSGYGMFDVYVDGKLIKKDVDDFCTCIPYGSTWELKNIRGLDGYHYEESLKGPTKGIAGENIEWEGYSDKFTDKTTICRSSYTTLKFYSNKLTINYHADGAQSWKTANVNNASEIDVTGKDIMETEALKYDELYSEDAEKQHFCSIARIKRDGYTAKANTRKVGQNGSLEVQDNKILQKAQDVAKYCGVLNEFKKNDTTIDLYPIWIPNNYTLTYDLNGGSFNAPTTQLFGYGSGDAISSEIPIKTGYDFVGWKWGDVTMQPGDTIPKGWGNFTLTAQWLKVYPMGTVLNIDGIEYMTVERKESGKYLVMTTRNIENRSFQSTNREDMECQNVYEGSEIDVYLENEWYNNLSSAMKVSIQSNNIKQVSYIQTFDNSNIKDETGYTGEPYNAISRHVFLPSVEEIGCITDLKNPDKVKAFLNEDNIWTRDSSKGYQYGHFYSNYGSMFYGNSGSLNYNYVYEKSGIRPAFVIDLSKIDYTVTGTVNYK